MFYNGLLDFPLEGLHEEILERDLNFSPEVNSKITLRNFLGTTTLES